MHVTLFKSCWLLRIETTTAVKKTTLYPQKTRQALLLLKLNRVSLASFNFSNLGEFSEVEFLRIVSKLKQRKENLSSCIHVLRRSRVVEVDKIMYQKAWCTIRVSFRGNTVIWKRFFWGGRWRRGGCFDQNKWK